MIRHLEEELTKQTREFILLQARAFKNQPFIRFFARHMQDFPTLKTLDQAGLEAGTPKECFRNAYELLCRHPNDYIYVEGFASNIIPVYHAWLLDHDGHVIDPTWNERGKAYCGVPFSTTYVSKAINRSATYGVVGGNERLLTGKDRNWKW